MFPRSTIRFLEGSVVLQKIPPITRADSGLLFKEPGGSDQIVNEKAAHIIWFNARSVFSPFILQLQTRKHRI